MDISSLVRYFPSLARFHGSRNAKTICVSSDCKTKINLKHYQSPYTLAKEFLEERRKTNGTVRTNEKAGTETEA